MCIKATMSRQAYNIYIYIYYYLSTQCEDYVSFDIFLPIVPSVEDVAGIVSLESGGVYTSMHLKDRGIYVIIV